MPAVYADDSSEDDRPDTDRALLRRRIGGFLLALAVEVLIVIAFLTLGPPKFGTENGDNRLKTFQMSNVADKPATKEQEKPAKKRTATVTPKTPPPPPAAVPPPTPLGPIPGLLVLTRQEYAAADIGKIKSQRAAVADAAPEGDDANDTEVAGAGPNGEPLYYAEWYREPTDAEMAFYIPKGLRSGSALIACKTVPKYRVEDCQLLGETPGGTGLARGVREAAWQFRVRPPRKGGKMLIGAWVRIRFDVVGRGAR
jgi:protein TonB